MKLVWSLAAALVVFGGPATGEDLTYVDLVRRLYDLEGLARLPASGEKCEQWSSYDRASRIDGVTGKHVAWDANGDGTGVIRTEGDELVLAEIEGPGVIWRIWSATPGKGRVRITLDGATQPQVDLPFSGYFDRMNAPFTYPSLVYQVAQGWNNYVPIPFQSSCKITADRDWGLYYHFTYTRYPKGTRLPTFTRALSEEALDALADADRFLRRNLGEDPAGKRAGERTVRSRRSVRPGGAATVATLTGARAITAIRVRCNLQTRGEQVAALREMALRITWDDDADPAVWAPLGDFFGTAPGVNLYRSLPLGMTSEGFYALWYMPFAKRARVELVNDGATARRMEVAITHAPLTRPIEEQGRFHAKWHRDAFLPSEPERWIDWPMLKTTGRGRYVGVHLHVWNPKGDWWGEGDEKFWVDGETFPSTFGTGSEDYFGYAWCSPDLFQNAFHSQSYNSGHNRGHISVNRWHVADNVPFQTAFQADIEKYFPNNRPTLYAATAYWYEAPGGGDPYRAASLADRTGYFDVEPPPAKKVEGAIEGEALPIVERTRGNAAPQELGGFGPDWSADRQLWWTGAEPGDRLTVAFDVETAGRYDLRAQLTKAPDYGVVQLWLDGAKLGDPIDLYHTSVIATGEMSLGIHFLTRGRHRLTAEIVGANAAARPAFMFGLDYLLLASAP
ncbi:MAG TPA: DUF2961 domain-containing protein [Chthonomonadales bacterium]|nr:DUF2961 domain-containing protein [Chthonomonadales bacterium]